MKTDENYLKELSRALRRHAIPETEIEQTIREVQETGNNTDRPLTEEFGSPQDYVKALYPETKPKQYYLFTLCGLILAAIGFILLTVYFRNLGTDGTAQSLWKVAALIAIPIGMAIDFTRYARA